MWLRFLVCRPFSLKTLWLPEKDRHGKNDWELLQVVAFGWSFSSNSYRSRLFSGFFFSYRLWSNILQEQQKKRGNVQTVHHWTSKSDSYGSKRECYCSCGQFLKSRRIWKSSHYYGSNSAHIFIAINIMITTALIGVSYASLVQFGTDRPQWRDGKTEGGLLLLS